MSKKAPWDGLYKNTEESKKSVEETILQLIDEGKFRGELPDGGTMEYGWNHYDEYHKSNSSKGHSHLKIRYDDNGKIIPEKSSYHD